MTLPLTSTHQSFEQDREIDLLDQNTSGDDDSTPLISPESLPVTVTHLSSKGKIELVQLSSESSSVTPTVKVVGKESPSKQDEKEIMIVQAPLVEADSSQTPDTNPFTSFCIEPENTQGNNNDDLFGYDQITSILINSKNPFYNPFLMPTNEVEVGGGPREPADDSGCKKSQGESVSPEVFCFKDVSTSTNFFLTSVKEIFIFFFYTKKILLQTNITSLYILLYDYHAI